MANRRINRTKSFKSYINSLNDDMSRLQARTDAAQLGQFSLTTENLPTDLILNNNSIQSFSYIPGYVGWKIDSSGVAEFSDVFIRGDINAQTGTIGYWNISSPEVERTIGTKKLFGTFLESADLGPTDIDKTSGVYVGLFKSYEDVDTQIIGATRVDNIATIFAPQHGYQVNDLVIIDIDDEPAFSTGESPVKVLTVTSDSFTYANIGPDVIESYNEETEEFTNTIASGVVRKYVKDIAGLYLQDYGRSQFDYGYFSNEGLAYVSAETLNLVKNPSAEYVAGGVGEAGAAAPDEVTGTSANWSVIPDGGGDPSGTITASELSNTVFSKDSIYGILCSWSNTIYNEYISVKANISNAVTYKYVENDRTLFLNFDVFYNKLTYNQVEITGVTVQAFGSGNAALFITTSTGHNLLPGDVIFLNAVIGGNYGNNIYESYGTVLSVESPTAFSIRYKTYYTGGTVPLSAAPKYNVVPTVFKYIQPVLDLEKIKIGIWNGTAVDVTTSLKDVITDITLAEWDSVRYWSMSRGEFIRFMSGDTTEIFEPLGIIDVAYSDFNRYPRIPVEIQVSSRRLYEKYKQISGSSYDNYEDFYICFPNHVLEGTEELSYTWYSSPTPSVPRSGGNLPAIADETMQIVYDNVSLSPSTKFFYGDSGSADYSYLGYDPLSETSFKFNYPSVEAPRQWMSIDLDSQTAQLKYWDSIEFESADFTKQIFLNPSIDTVNRGASTWDITYYSTINVGDASVLNFTSGAYRYYYGFDSGSGQDVYRQTEAIASAKTGSKTSYFEIKTSADLYNSSGVKTGDGGWPAQLKLAMDDAVTTIDSTWAESVASLEGSRVLFTAQGKQYNSQVQIFSDPSLIYLTSNTINLNAPALYANQIYGLTVTGSPRTVYINNAGRLGGISSSRSTKENIRPIEYSVDSLLSVEPVMFTYIGQEEDKQYAGFIAEQLDELGLSAYVSYDDEGKPVTVNYEFYVSALQSVVKHLATQVQELSSRVENLENQ